MLYNFPIRFKGDDILRYVFPSKQKAVQKTLDLAKKDNRINKIILFGSAITLRCGDTSDIDIALDTSSNNEDDFLNIVKPFYREVPSEIDIIHLNTVKSELLKKEISKGLCIYAKQ